MKRIVIHVGMPKTGTTFLQQRCFPHLSDVHYSGWEDRPDTPTQGIIDRLTHLVRSNSLLFDLEQEKRTVDRMLAVVPDQTVLISYERLFGNMFYNFHDHAYLTRSLGHLFPQASIALVIRRQDDLLESVYRQALSRYFSPNVDGFLNHADGHLHDHVHLMTYPSVNARQLNLHAYVRNYAETFGRDNLLVLPYERMRADQRGFLTDLYRFIGVDGFYPTDQRRVHQSYSLLSSRIARLLNPFVRAERRETRPWQFIPDRPFSGFLNGRSARSPLHRAVAEANRRLSLNYVLLNVVDRFSHHSGNLISADRRKLVMNAHSESNRALDDEFGLGLAEYGYY